jgi:hypothetical protein
MLYPVVPLMMLNCFVLELRLFSFLFNRLAELEGIYPEKILFLIPFQVMPSARICLYDIANLHSHNHISSAHCSQSYLLGVSYLVGLLSQIC